MRFYTKQHLYYCGIDLQTRTMYVGFLDQDGKIAFHTNIKLQFLPSRWGKGRMGVFFQTRAEISLGSDVVAERKVLS